jgi:malate synthase
VGIRYIESWLRGNGAVAIHNLMEDAATAEISRSQIWQWIRQSAITDEGEIVSLDWVQRLLDEEFAKLPRFEDDLFDDAREIFEEVALGEEFPAFLTVPAYERYLHEKREELVAA